MSNELVDLSIYQEHNFMKNRDIEKYIVRQAESCIWLHHRMKEYLEDSAFEPYYAVIEYLQRVHSSQLGLLVNGTEGLLANGTDLGLPDHSYYFDSLFSRTVDVSSSFRPQLILWIHCVSYFRGHQRYIDLDKEYGKVWSILKRDSILNGNLLFSCLAWAPNSGYPIMDRVVGAETELMARIDKKNGENG